MEIKTHKLLQCVGVAIGGAIVYICGRNYINDALEIAAEEAYERSMDDGVCRGFEIVNNWLIKTYGTGKAKEIWDDIWPTNRMRK